jgi:hypothetical protein
MTNVSVGDLITVAWSNGVGESVYRVVDTLTGPHGFELVSEGEYPLDESDFGDDWVMPDGFEFVPNPNAEPDHLTAKNHAERYGDDDGMDADDMKAVLADIRARRGVAK